MTAVKNKTILLVEDEGIIALAESKAIKRFGYDVIIANTGEAAVQLAAGNDAINLVLMDIDLGMGINGPDAAAQILKKQTIPIVFLTSHSEREMVEKVRGITRYGYVIKNSGDFVLQTSIETAFELFEAIQTMEKTNHKNDALLAALPDTMFVISRDGVFLDCHQSCDFTLIIAPELFLGRNVADVLPKELADLTSFHLHAVLESGETASYEYSVMISDEIRFYDARMVRCGGESVLSIVRDVTGRKRAESKNKIAVEALRESEKQFRMLIENLHVGVMLHGPDAKIILCNPMAADLFGLRAEEMQGKSSGDFARHIIRENGTLLPQEEIPVNRILSSGESFEYDVLGIVRSDAPEPTWVICHGYQVLDERGLLSQAVVTFVDITDRKKAEQALQESEEKYRTLVEEFPDAIAIHVQGTIVFVSNAVVELMRGANVEEFLGKPVIDFVHPDSREFVRMRMIKGMKEGKPQPLAKEKFIRHDGTAVDVEVKAIPITFEKKPAVQLIIRDITDRLRVENALKESEEKYRMMIQHSSDPIFSFNPDETYRFVNEALAKAFGKSPEEIIGKTPFAFFPRDEAEKRLSLMRQVFKTGEKGEVEGTVISRTGDAKYFLTMADPVKNSNGDIEWITCISKDITERKQAEEKIHNLLKEKNILLKEVHHRIKNNLNTVMSMLSLQSDAIDHPAASAALNNAGGRIRSMMALYDKLYRSEEFGSMSVKEYLSPLVDEIIANFPNKEIVTIEKNIEDFALDARIISPVGIIINELLTNIMKYEFIGRERGTITVSASMQGKKAVIAIQDDGIGIPESIDFANPAGFGLHVVDMLVKQIDGAIRIERGSGTKFIVEFEER